MNQLPLQIVLASNARLWLQEIHAYLDTLPGIKVVQEVAYGVNTLVSCYENQPDIVLLDFNPMPLPSGTLIAALHHFVPTTRIIGCTTVYRAEVATLVRHSHSASYIVDQDLHQSLTQILTIVMAGYFWHSRLR